MLTITPSVAPVNLHAQLSICFVHSSLLYSTLMRYCKQMMRRSVSKCSQEIKGNINKQQENDDCLFVGCLKSQQHASVSQGRIYSDNFTCCHTEIEVADQNFYLTQSQYIDTRPTSSSADPIMPGVWQGSHWSASF